MALCCVWNDDDWSEAKELKVRIVAASKAILFDREVFVGSYLIFTFNAENEL